MATTTSDRRWLVFIDNPADEDSDMTLIDEHGRDVIRTCTYLEGIPRSDLVSRLEGGMVTYSADRFPCFMVAVPVPANTVGVLYTYGDYTPPPLDDPRPAEIREYILGGVYEHRRALTCIDDLKEELPAIKDALIYQHLTEDGPIDYNGSEFHIVDFNHKLTDEAHQLMSN